MVLRNTWLRGLLMDRSRTVDPGTLSFQLLSVRSTSSLSSSGPQHYTVKVHYTVIHCYNTVLHYTIISVQSESWESRVKNCSDPSDTKKVYFFLILMSFLKLCRLVTRPCFWFNVQKLHPKIGVWCVTGIQKDKNEIKLQTSIS